MKREIAIITRTRPVSFTGGKWTYATDRDEVRVMSRAEGYAMVRFPRCMPFVCSEKDLSPITPEEAQSAKDKAA